MTRSPRFPRALAVALLAGVAAATGCGDGDDGGSEQAAKPAPKERASTDGASSTPDVTITKAQERAVAKLDPPERPLARDVLTSYRGMAAGDAKAVCAGMSPRMRKRNVGFAGGEGATTCVQVIGSYLAAAGQDDSIERWGRMKLVDVELRGPERGVITLTFGKRTNAIPVRRIDGRWKIDGSGTPVRQAGG